MRDQIAPRPVLSSEVSFTGAIWNVVTQDVDLGAAGVVNRHYVEHPGAVGVLALNEAGEVLVVRQYRHPVRSFLWELPAGLLDEPGEAPWLAAARELAEEADLCAAQWHTLVDWYNSPGGNSEAIRVYLARGISEVPEAKRHVRTGEELEMTSQWVPLEELAADVLAGNLHNPTLVVGVLAAQAARAQDWRTLRAVDAAWPEHPAYR